MTGACEGIHDGLAGRRGPESALLGALPIEPLREYQEVGVGVLLLAESLVHATKLVPDPLLKLKASIAHVRPQTQPQQHFPEQA